MNELAITSGSLIMMPFCLLEVLDALRFLPRIVLMLDHTFLLFPKELVQFQLVYLWHSHQTFQPLHLKNIHFPYHTPHTQGLFSIQCHWYDYSSFRDFHIYSPILCYSANFSVLPMFHTHHLFISIFIYLLHFSGEDSDDSSDSDNVDVPQQIPVPHLVIM